jgi:hypothetical protein
MSSNVILLLLMMCAVTMMRAQPVQHLRSEGTITNEGVITVHGNARIDQAAIGGQVEYRRDRADSQFVAHTTYQHLLLSGQSRKMLIDGLRPVRTTQMFLTTDSLVTVDLTPATFIEALDSVNHRGHINPLSWQGTLRLAGAVRQPATGNGSTPVLEIANADAVRLYGLSALRVTHRLDLQRGRVENTATDNINLDSAAWLWRRAEASLQADVRARGLINLRWYGDSAILAGPEVPLVRATLDSVRQDVLAGVTLSRDAWVNGHLSLAGTLYTDEFDTVRHAIYLNTPRDPTFVNTWAEVDGTMQRTALLNGPRMLMNHAYTWVQFSSPQQQGAVQQIRIRSKPLTRPLPISDILYKVDRSLELSFLDSASRNVPDSSFDMTMGWGWRINYDPTIEGAKAPETTQQLIGKESQLVLLRYDGSLYQQYGFSQLPTLSSVESSPLWRYSSTQFVRARGSYAIGMSGSPVWALRGRVILEGAVRSTGDAAPPLMSTELVQRGLLPQTPPRIYPYLADLEPKGDTVAVLADSLVDWVTLEFRRDLTSTGMPEHIETLILSAQGALLDPRTLREKTIDSIQPGLYHLVVRHRNHLSIATADPVLIDRSNAQAYIDFTNGSGLFGGASTQRLISAYGNRRYFGMTAGNTDGGLAVLGRAEVITDDDMLGVWTNRGVVKRYSIFDTNLDGVVTTLDWDTSWNNRGRDNSAIPR